MFYLNLKWQTQKCFLNNDKSQIYMRFTLIYLVFCIVCHLFWHFYVCFYLVGDVQVERSKNKQSEAKRSQKKHFWAKQKSMSWHGFVMPQHEITQSKNPRPACRSMPNSCRSMPRQFEDKILKTCPNHAAAWWHLSAWVIFGN